MNITTLERIKTLLENYDKKLQAKGETYANFMADWADTSQSETIRYADKYTQVRLERQRVHYSMLEIDYEIKSYNEKEKE